MILEEIRNTDGEMDETDQGSLSRCRTSLGSQRRVRGNWTAFDLSTTCTDGVVKTSWKWLAQYDPYYGGSSQTRWPLARRPRSAREEGCSIEEGGGSGGAGISYLQLATLGLSGRFSSGNISLHCPPRGDDVGIPVRMAVCRANIVSVDWISLNGKKETNESLVDRYGNIRVLKYSCENLVSRRDWNEWIWCTKISVICIEPNETKSED